MSLRYLLDTSVISAVIAKEPDARIVKRLELHAHESAIAAPVLHELTYGCERLEPGKRRTAIEAFVNDVVLRSFPVLPYDEAAAVWHGQERALLERSGKMAPFADGQIASVARVHDLVLVTSNVKDFKRFRELRVESWASRAAG